MARIASSAVLKDFFVVKCPECHTELACPKNFGGRRLRCKKCDSGFNIPVPRQHMVGLEIRRVLVKKSTLWTLLATAAMVLILIRLAVSPAVFGNADVIAGGNAAGLQTAEGYETCFNLSDLQETQQKCLNLVRLWITTNNGVARARTRTAFQNECSGVVGQTVEWAMPVFDIHDGYVMLVDRYGPPPHFDIRFVGADGFPEHSIKNGFGYNGPGIYGREYWANLKIGKQVSQDELNALADDGQIIVRGLIDEVLHGVHGVEVNLRSVHSAKWAPRLARH